MFDDFFRALGQLGDPRFRNVLLKGLGLTVGLLAAITIAMTWLVGFLVPDTLSLPFVGEISWVNGLALWASVLLMLVLSVILMVPCRGSLHRPASWTRSLTRSRPKHYPHLPPNPETSLMNDVRESLGFFGVIVGVNLIALILFFFVGPLAPILFYAVNGYLLGREYFTMAAMRRMPRADAHALRRRHNAQIWFAGCLMAVPLSVPLVNLLIPILGAASFTHMFHRLAGR